MSVTQTYKASFHVCFFTLREYFTDCMHTWQKKRATVDRPINGLYV